MAGSCTTLPNAMCSDAPELGTNAWSICGAKGRRITRSLSGNMECWRSEDGHLHSISRPKLNGNRIEVPALASLTIRQRGGSPSAVPITIEGLRDDRYGEDLPRSQTTTLATGAVMTKHGRAEPVRRRLPIDWRR
ncbi:hypothetical protein [Litoreibacter roseus]|uniref:Uncharacterized protein n=1 Tax=Litoreibacter roseus TaxID=2601869 RepID=A0A6N6JMC3_9RHOB|nr:hypothetical protein [Litoreibacter roseus]GFE67030.1 hypothetical protein KIN_41040 [Litoreibacter roseus]